MANPLITPEEIRLFMMDRAELNPLLLGIRWTQEMINQAMINTVDYFNLMLPPIGVYYTIEKFPFRGLLLLGTSGYLLRSAAINEAGNQFSYAADGVQINDKDKAQIFLELGNQLWTEFKELAQNIRISQNIAQVYGTKNSEYIYRDIG
jgi:hypothetical protein